MIRRQGEVRFPHGNCLASESLECQFCLVCVCVVAPPFSCYLFSPFKVLRNTDRIGLVG